MTRLLVVLGLLACCAVALRAQDVEVAIDGPPAPAPAPAGLTVHVGLGSATDAAAQDGALIFVVFESQSCPACREFDRKTLASPIFQRGAGRLHVVYLDVETAPKTATLFKVGVVPDLVLMTAEMKVVARAQGALSPDALVKWIEQARQRVARGTWDGTADDGGAAMMPSVPSSAEDYRRLVQALGSAESLSAERAATMLETEWNRAVPHLIDGLEDPYLGARIGANDLLRRMAPAVPAVDVWDAADARREQVALVREWWKKTGELPPPAAVATVKPEETRTVDDALDGALSQDPLRRTRGMTTLVKMGSAALPRLREAIRKVTEAGDQKSLWVLEDARWAILVPEPLERAAAARRDLARGTSEKRQAATARLGKLSAAALPALRELIDDADGLVRESAVLALRTVGGPDALAAVATLLKAKDPNLRMVAAQALGNSKNIAAAQYLVTAVNDPDEVVAGVAIAALVEVKAKDKASVLVGCLADKRWRVRAAAAEAIGALEIKTANEELLKLLLDGDAFVAKSALSSLRKTSGAPGIATLRELIKRTPDLTGPAVACALQNDTPATLKIIETIYDESIPERRRDVIEGLREAYSYGSNRDDHWKPLLTKAAQSKDPLLRLRLVDILERRTATTATEFLTPLLDDEDVEVRAAGAAVVLKVAAHHWGVSGDEDKSDYGILKVIEEPPKAEKKPADGEVAATAAPESASDRAVVEKLRVQLRRQVAGLSDIFRGNAAGDEEEKKATPEEKRRRAAEVRDLHRRWHESLRVTFEKKPTVPAGLAFYVTGDGKTDLPVLERVLSRPDLKEQSRMLRYGGTSVVMARLPWPEGKDVAAKVCRSPFVYTLFADSWEHVPKKIRECLVQPDVVVGVIESARGDDFASVARSFLEELREGREGVSLYPATPANEESLRRLVASKEPGARTVGVFVVGTRAVPAGAGTDNATRLGAAVVEKALSDENPWVRCAAVRGVASIEGNPLKREEKLAPHLADANAAVATQAAFGILDEKLRGAAGFSDYNYLQFEDQHVWRSYTSSSDREGKGALPPPVERKPAFLDVLRRRLAEKPPEESPDVLRMKEAFAVLLAQYGDYRGLDAELEQWKTGKSEEASPALLMGIALTKDPKFLDPLKKMVEKTEDTYRLRPLLNWLEGVPGQDARALRREINRRIQAGGE